MIKNSLLNKIISIVLAVITVVLGALFILQAVRLNNHYTQALIGRVFLQILAVVILWAVVFILSLFTKTEESKKRSKLKYFTKRVSEKTYLFINIGYLVVVLICAAFTIAYIVQKKHFSFEFNKDILAIVYYLLPFVGILLVVSLVRAVFVVAPKRKERKPMEKKQIIILNSVRAGLLVVALALIVIGAVNKQAEDVLTKAIKICLECIGIG